MIWGEGAGKLRLYNGVSSFYFEGIVVLERESEIMGKVLER